MPIFVRLPPIYLLLVVVLLAQGCAPVIKPVPPSRISPAEAALQEQVSALEKAEDYAAAAQLLESNLANMASARRDALRLQAGELWARAEAWDKVEASLRTLAAPLPDDLNLRRRMLAAELSIARRNLEQALQLMQPPVGADNPLPLRRRYHKNLAEIYRLSGNLLESARQLVALDALLQDPAKQLMTQQKLVETLSTMTDTALSMLQPAPPGVLGGWMELVRIMKRQHEDPTHFQTRIEAWREEHPGHPALPELLSGYLDQPIIDQTSHIAIMLPRSGPYTKVAAAVRDGFMVAWYQRPTESRPALRFYDSSDPERILGVYQKALQRGAHLMVGPLNKDALSQLMNVSHLEIPVLALNQLDKSSGMTHNLYQFSLAPEDEAEQAAERAWLDGHSAALALTPNDDWGRRLYRSFKQRWESLGGRMLEHQVYDPKGNDFSRPIRLLLNVSERKASGGSQAAQPPRRTDAHFIFLAARAHKARQLGPQLKFFHADGLPVYATSHIYDSSGNTQLDKDLGQIKFVDTAWLLEQDNQSDLSRQRLQRLIPEVRGSYARLYAMGIDAFNLLPYLKPTYRQIGPILHGKTGSLYRDPFNRIHRQLAWAEIDNGVARIIGYAPRLNDSMLSPAGARTLEGRALPYKARPLYSPANR